MELQPVATKPFKFYSDPTDDPSFEMLQKFYYERLYEMGFRDAEDFTRGGFEIDKKKSVDANHGGRPLKTWASTKRVELNEKEVFPSQRFQAEIKYFSHPEFKYACEKVCQHKLNSFRPRTVVVILKLRIKGMSNHAIARKLNTTESSIRRMLKKMKCWMDLL